MTIYQKLDQILHRIVDLFNQNDKIREALRPVAEDLAVVKGIVAQLALDRKLDRALLEFLAANFLRPATSIRFDVYDMAGGLIEKGATQMILFRNTSRKVVANPRDEDGNVAKLDGKLNITTLNPAVTLSEISEDGLSFTMSAGGLAGSGPISAEGDADPGPDVVQVAGSLDVTVPAGNAVSIDFQLGDEVPNPAP